MRDRDRPVVRLSSDYCAAWPLWDRFGGMDPGALDLSPELVARVRAWQEHFETAFHYEHGWRSVHDAAAYAAEGRQLHHLLTTEIGRWVRIELDLWPVAPAEPAGDRHKAQSRRRRAP